MVVKLTRGFIKRFTSQRGRERVDNYKFSKVNVLRKGRSEDKNQEETGLKVFSQSEGDAKAMMVKCNRFSARFH